MIVEPAVTSQYKNVTKRNASVVLAITKALLEGIDECGWAWLTKLAIKLKEIQFLVKMSWIFVNS